VRTDLYGWVELYSPYSEMWCNVIRIDALDNRNYELYQWLFGIKKVLGSVQPIAEKRGMPPNPSAETESDYLADVTHFPQEYFGLTWISWTEIEAIDWGAPLDDRVLERQKNQIHDIWQESWKSAFVQRHSDAWNTRPNHLAQGEPWEYGDSYYRIEHTTGRELWRDGWDVLWVMAEALATKYGNENVRLVVWFGI
jgi:hypothetical protein